MCVCSSVFCPQLYVDNYGTASSRRSSRSCSSCVCVIVRGRVCVGVCVVLRHMLITVDAASFRRSLKSQVSFAKEPYKRDDMNYGTASFRRSSKFCSCDVCENKRENGRERARVNVCGYVCCSGVRRLRRVLVCMVVSLCVYVCKYMCVHIYIYVYTRVYVCVRMYVGMCVRRFAAPHTRTLIRTHVYTYT